MSNGPHNQTDMHRNASAPLATTAAWMSLALATIGSGIGGCVSNGRAPEVSEPSRTTSVDAHPLRAHYELSGGGMVDVLKPFGGETYMAVVNIRGPYPEVGSWAHNVGRDEFVYVTAGQLSVWIDEQALMLREGDTCTFSDGSWYRIEGNGSCVVLVKDAPGGKTQVGPRE